MHQPDGMRNVDDLIATLHLRGAAHTARLRDEGFSPYAMSMAVARGGAERVRRSWLIAATCDPAERKAAEIGGRLTCVSAARRHGLWTPDHEGIHLAVPATASRVDATGERLHWATGPAPVTSHALCDPPINVLFHVARCLPLGDALTVWESAIRRQVVDPDELRRIRWRSSAAGRLASQASDLSDSGIETRFVALMRDLGASCRQQVWIDGHPVDALVGERLVVQLDGFAHHRGADRRRDLRADARLVLRGYTVLRFDFVQVLFHPDEVAATIALAMAQGLHLASR